MAAESIMAGLRGIAGEDAVFAGEDALAPFIDSNGTKTGLVRVLPGDTEQAVAAVNAARGENLPVYTVRSRYMPGGLEGAGGVLIDPARLDYVKKVDDRNMMAFIGAGVTFEQLKPLLDEVGMRLLTPACADSPYVVRSYLDRDVLVGEIEHRHTQLSVFHAVLADGRVWASGSHQMGQEGHADFREDQGPQFSPFFGASEDIYGVPVYGIVYIYPVRQERRELAFGFEELEGAVRFSYKASREEHCFELVGGDAAWWSELTAGGGSDASVDRTGLAPWTVVMSIEHRPDLVEIQQALVEKDAASLGGQKLDYGTTELLAGNFGRPWYLWDRACMGALKHVFCYTFCDRVPDTITTATAPAREAGFEGQLASCFIPVYRGGAFYCESDIHHFAGDGERAAAAWRSAYESLLEQGALVDKPKGELAGMVFSRAKPSYISMIKRLKRILDPDGMINPGQLLEGI